MSDYIIQNSEKREFSNGNSWVILSPIEQRIKDKIESVGTPLNDWGVKINRGILTGYNEAFIISGEKREEILSNCKSDDERKRTVELIRPILRGKDVKRYGYTFKDKWLINTHNGIKQKNVPPVNINDYPAIKVYLDLFYSKLNERQDKGYTPYNLRNCVYLEDFSKQKIVWGNLCLSAQYSLVENDYFISAPSPMIVPGNKYLLAILNSKIADWYIRGLGVTRNGGYFEYKPMFVEKLPIPKPTKEIERKIMDIVTDILNLKNTDGDTVQLEQKLDEIINNLYGLDSDEIEIINKKI